MRLKLKNKKYNDIFGKNNFVKNVSDYYASILSIKIIVRFLLWTPISMIQSKFINFKIPLDQT